MGMPYVTETSKSTQFIQSFGGFNNNLRCDDSEFGDMENISLDNYPAISTRTGKKHNGITLNNPFGVHRFRGNHIIENYQISLYCYDFDNPSDTRHSISGTFSADEKCYATIGKYTLIMPDKKVFVCSDDVSQSHQVIDIEKEFASVSSTLTPCNLEGGTTGDLNYVKIETSDTSVRSFLNEYSEYDTITLQCASLYSSYTDCVIFGFTESNSVRNGIIVSAQLNASATENVSYKRKCPSLTHIISLNNRIWGVDNENHLIYACKLGNPFQWYNNAGISSDSYYVDIGYGEYITASVSYSNYPHFFTESKIIKIYGDYPSNYQVYTTVCDGVKDGCDKTPVVVNGYLYYLGVNGIMVYDGSLPSNISSNFEPNYFYEKVGVAGKDANKYVICIKHIVTEEEADDVYHYGDIIVYGVFAYDTSAAIWTKYDNDDYMFTYEIHNSLCYVNRYGINMTFEDRDEESDQTVGVIDYLDSSRIQASW